MTTAVWVLMRADYEDCCVVSVHSTEASAEIALKSAEAAECQQCVERSNYVPYGFWVDEHEVLH